MADINKVRGRLSTKEKYAIQELLNKNKTVKSISTKLKRTENAIQNYVDGELTKIKTTVKKIRNSELEELKIQLEQAKQTVKELTDEKNKGDTINDMVGWVQGELNHVNGLDGKDVGRLITAALQKNGDPPNKNVLLQWALGEINARNLMIRKTGENKEGIVTAMTKGASERGDALRDSMLNNISRTARHNLYRPLDGTMID